MARGLDWVEVDHYYNGYEARRQKELAGHRLTAHLIYSALAEEKLSPAQFLPLPIIDGPPKALVALPQGEESYADFKARLVAENAKKQAQAAT